MEKFPSLLKMCQFIWGTRTEVLVMLRIFNLTPNSFKSWKRLQNLTEKALERSCKEMSECNTDAIHATTSHLSQRGSVWKENILMLLWWMTPSTRVRRGGVLSGERWGLCRISDSSVLHYSLCLHLPSIPFRQIWTRSSWRQELPLPPSVELLTLTTPRPTLS